MRQLNFAIGIILLACISASPGCMASLGSRAKDQARAEDIGSTIGGVASVHPGIAAAATVAAPITDLAAREGQRRADATPEGEPLDLWTQILLGIGAFGGVFTLGKTGVRAIVAKAAESSAAPKPPGT